ncbi:MAG: hypothetical protein WBD81_11115 [Collimonas pratensis]|uniref:hypothetical protein n=1 Tax=Collimonas pratensis TaxID=279113 RepID=UPI003C76E01C
MSHPVFLNDCKLPAMPSGERNEWRAFWDDARIELEANGGPPLLWWCIYGEADLKFARMIDDFDIDDPEGERAEFQVDTENPDALYPYFVTAKKQALQRLAQRKEKVVAALGEQYRAVYEAFEKLVATHFDGFVLLRTAGLPDIADGEQWMRTGAQSMDRLDNNHPPEAGDHFAGMAAEFLKWKNSGNAARMLGGSGPPDVWPDAALSAAFPETGRRKRTAPENTDPDAPQTLPPNVRGRSGQRKSTMLEEWLAPLFVGLVTAYVYLSSRSIFLAVLAFAAATALAVWLSIKWRNRGGDKDLP